MADAKVGKDGASAKSTLEAETAVDIDGIADSIFKTVQSDAAPPVASTSTAFEAPTSIADSLWKSVKYGVTTSVFGGLKTDVVPVVVNPLVESVKDDMKTSASKPTATSSVEVARNDVKASLVGASKGVLALKPIADSVLESMKDDVKPSLFGGPKIASKPFTDSLFGSVREEVKPSLFGAPKSVVASVEESRVESGKDMKLLGAPKTSIASVADSLLMSVKDDVKPSLFRGPKNYADSLLKSVNDDAKPLLFEVQKTSIAPKSVADSLFESVKEDLKPSLFGASKVVTAPKSVANSIFQIVKDDVKSVVPISREMKPVVAPTSFADFFFKSFKDDVKPSHRLSLTSPPKPSQLPVPVKSPLGGQTQAAASIAVKEKPETQFGLMEDVAEDPELIVQADSRPPVSTERAHTELTPSSSPPSRESPRHPFFASTMSHVMVGGLSSVGSADASGVFENDGRPNMVGEGEMRGLMDLGEWSGIERVVVEEEEEEEAVAGGEMLTGMEEPVDGGEKTGNGGGKVSRETSASAAPLSRENGARGTSNGGLGASGDGGDDKKRTPSKPVGSSHVFGSIASRPIATPSKATTVVAPRASPISQIFSGTENAERQVLRDLEFRLAEIEKEAREASAGTLEEEEEDEGYGEVEAERIYVKMRRLVKDVGECMGRVEKAGKNMGSELEESIRATSMRVAFVQASKVELEKQVLQMEERVKKAQDVITNLRKASNETGITGVSTVNSGQAALRSKKSIGSFVTRAIFFVALFLVLQVYFLWVYQSMNTTPSTSSTFPSLTVLSPSQPDLPAVHAYPPIILPIEGIRPPTIMDNFVDFAGFVIKGISAMVMWVLGGDTVMGVEGLPI